MMPAVSVVVNVTVTVTMTVIIAIIVTTTAIMRAGTAKSPSPVSPQTMMLVDG